jgi:hypothetical protein
MVRPKDFDSPLPPARFTADMLSAFIEAIDRYTNLS